MSVFPMGKPAALNWGHRRSERFRLVIDICVAGDLKRIHTGTDEMLLGLSRPKGSHTEDEITVSTRGC
jgi:hypothetical protein